MAVEADVKEYIELLEKRIGEYDAADADYRQSCSERDYDGMAAGKAHIEWLEKIVGGAVIDLYRQGYRLHKPQEGE